MKKILLLLCLLLLVSCGAEQTDIPPKVNAPENPTTETPATPDKTPDKTPEVEPPKVEAPERTPEQQMLDNTLIMLLREQLAGAYPVKGATFTFTANEELEGKECFAYEMKNGDTTEIFAVATDGTAIFNLQGKDFVKIIDLE